MIHIEFDIENQTLHIWLAIKLNSKKHYSLKLTATMQRHKNHLKVNKNKILFYNTAAKNGKSVKNASYDYDVKDAKNRTKDAKSDTKDYGADYTYDYVYDYDYSNGKIFGLYYTLGQCFSVKYLGKTLQAFDNLL